MLVAVCPALKKKFPVMESDWVTEVHVSCVCGGEHHAGLMSMWNTDWGKKPVVIAKAVGA